jgi:hypothetical protein
MMFLVISAISLLFGLLACPMFGHAVLDGIIEKGDILWLGKHGKVDLILVQTFYGLALWIPVLFPFHPLGPISVIPGCVTTCLQSKLYVKCSWPSETACLSGWLPSSGIFIFCRISSQIYRQ